MPTIAYPRLAKIRQHFPNPKIHNATAAVEAEIRRILQAANIRPGMKVGITAGSRGIQNIVPMLKAAARTVREFNAEPVFLAAMGSHGGGTEAGQLDIMASFGMTAEALGAPVIPCAKGRELGVTERGLHAYMLESAFNVDAIIPFNRIKTHTSFKGDIESGLIKKLVVGLGGPQGARQFHSQGKASDLSPLLRDVGELILQKMPVIGGVAIIENAYEETALIKGIIKDGLLREEMKLLAYSKTLMPSLPVKNLDALIVEELGKNYSGTGFDTNIVGRMCIQGEEEPKEPFIRYLAVWDLAEEAHGNAYGMGLADFTTKKLVDKIDKKSTYLNSLTTTFPMRVKIPLHLDTEKEVFEAVLRCLEGSVPPEKVRLAVIPNTLFLTECYISEALLPEITEGGHAEILETPVEISFDQRGDMRPRVGKHPPERPH